MRAIIALAILTAPVAAQTGSVATDGATVV
jgi:hypothetical protein